jgi:hypothetical protein
MEERERYYSFILCRTPLETIYDYYTYRLFAGKATYLKKVCKRKRPPIVKIYYTIDRHRTILNVKQANYCIILIRLLSHSIHSLILGIAFSESGINVI